MHSFKREQSIVGEGQQATLTTTREAAVLVGKGQEHFVPNDTRNLSVKKV